MIVHIVMFKFKEQNREANTLEMKKKLEALVGVVPTLKSMEVGIDFSKSPRAYDLSLYSTFDDKDALQAYAIHEEHLKVVEFVKEMTIESKVVDYIK
ncbi:MAG: Dabb family protein [Sulfurimonas sp.]|nr:Dabb family protein [Sulfurimonas sp.]MDD3835702.1 Dabb family protein [Sulfurimonas sp.]